VSESDRLLNIEKELEKHIIGQMKAITSIAKSVRRNRTGLNRRNRPIGSFVFLGPSGVGKTETARALARFLFDDPKALIRVDMSEYMEKFNVSRLIGAPPGYVGYDEGGQLSERVRRKPYSIILLDEIEKAHPDIFNVLLQVLDDGSLTDGTGRTVDFRNTILIMTSNVGSKEASKSHDFGFVEDSNEDDIDYLNMSEKMQNIMKDVFRPEFINRVDEVIVYRHLSRSDVNTILDINIEDVRSRLGEMGIELEISSAVKDFILDKGFNQDNGARLIQRMVERHIENPIAENLLRDNFGEGTVIHANMKSGKIDFNSRKIKKSSDVKEATVPSKPSAAE
jgi:ATP-dependent Clp protease ATP-binding subunit ClpC